MKTKQTLEPLTLLEHFIDSKVAEYYLNYWNEYAFITSKKFSESFRIKNNVYLDANSTHPVIAF